MGQITKGFCISRSASMWVKYVVPKKGKRKSFIIFVVRPIFKSHLNCYGSMTSKDTFSAVKRQSFTDGKKENIFSQLISKGLSFFC